MVHTPKPAKKLVTKAVRAPTRNPSSLPKTTPTIIIINEARFTIGIDIKIIRPAVAIAVSTAIKTIDSTVGLDCSYILKIKYIMPTTSKNANIKIGIDSELEATAPLSVIGKLLTKFSIIILTPLILINKNDYNLII